MSDGLFWHLVGLVLGGLSVGAVAVGSHALRRHLIPTWSGPPALLVDIVIGLSLVLVVSLALGAVGLFRLAPLTIGFVVTGMGMRALVQRSAPRTAHPDVAPVMDASLVGPGTQAFAVAAVVIVLAEWGMRTWWTVQHGIHTIDSIWYHLPVAARWAQDGTITPLHHLESEPLTTFYPFNGSVFHALGMVFLGNDLLSVVLNLGWLALALLAAWCIGRPWGVAPLGLGVVAVLCTTPSLMATQPGGGYTDITGIALLLAALAVLVTAAHRDRAVTVPEQVLAALAAGAALGTKFQFLVPVAALTLGTIVMAPAGRRIRTAAWWSSGLVATGAFWYLRNTFAVGNPLPAQEIEIGPLHLHAAPVQSPFTTFAEYMFDPDAWTDYLLSGFDTAVGWFWWLLLGAFAVFGVTGLLQSRLPRLLSFVAITTLLAFLVSPAIYGYGDDPVHIGVVLRYIAPGLVLAGIAAVVAAAEAGRWWRWALTTVLVLYLVGLQVRVNRWGEYLEQEIDETLWHPVSLLALGLAAIALAAGFVLVRTARTSRRHLVFVLAALAIGLAVVSVPLRRHYLEHRYAERRGILEVAVDVTWALDLRDERIATLGYQFPYPLYGPDLSNHVERPGTQGRYGAFEPLGTCQEWRTFLNDGRYTYVETGPLPLEQDDPPSAERWTATDPAATEVHQNGRLRVYRLDGPLEVDGCPDDER